MGNIFDRCFRYPFYANEVSNNKHGDFIQQLVGSKFMNIILHISATNMVLAHMFTVQTKREVLVMTFAALNRLKCVEFVGKMTIIC